MSAQLSLGLGRKPRPCCNVIGEPHGAATKYCGAPAAPGSDYCPACRAVLYRGQGPELKVPFENCYVLRKYAPKGAKLRDINSVDHVFNMPRRNFGRKHGVQ